MLELFRAYEYGREPLTGWSLSSCPLAVDEEAFDGVATRKEIRVALEAGRGGLAFTLLRYLPNSLRRAGLAAPLFLGLNFFGNHTVSSDPQIALTESWVPSNSVTRGQPAALLRGVQSSSWPVRSLLERGFGLATAYCGEIVADRVDALASALLIGFRSQRPGQRDPDAWGAIGGWAWGLSRAMDYLCTDGDVDAKRVVVIGHSRLGKAALWAGAQDERFAMVVANNSGCGGAALANRKFGERVADINAVNPHWFCENFRQFDDHEEALPFDQHELLALIAPRPAYVASARQDLPADPMGEFLAAKHAGLVYGFLGLDGLPADQLPATDQPAVGTIGYHIRTGQHAITRYDWDQFVAFAEAHFGNQASFELAHN